MDANNSGSRNKPINLVTGIFTGILTLAGAISGYINYFQKETSIVGNIRIATPHLKPIEGAIVELPNNNNEQGRIDSNGNFSLPPIKGFLKSTVLLTITYQGKEIFYKSIPVSYKNDTIRLDAIISSTNNSKQPNIYKAPTDNSEKQTIQPVIPVVNPDRASIVQVKMGLSCLKNNQQTITYFSALRDWLAIVPKDSKSIPLAPKEFSRIYSGDIDWVLKNPSCKGVKYCCFLNVTSKILPSDVDAALVVAQNTYQIVIVETGSAQVVDSFEITEKAAGISATNAGDRVNDYFLKDLKEHKLNI